MGTNFKVSLVSGTLRSNLDPFHLHNDVTLWDALKRSYIVESTNQDQSLMTTKDEEASSNAHTRFSLDTVIEDEGGNLSLGQVLFHCSGMRFEG